MNVKVDQHFCRKCKETNPSQKSKFGFGNKHPTKDVSKPSSLIPSDALKRDNLPPEEPNSFLSERPFKNPRVKQEGVSVGDLKTLEEGPNLLMESVRVPAEMETSEAVPAEDKVYCQNHPNRKLEIVCRDEHCQKLVCLECVAFGHHTVS